MNNKTLIVNANALRIPLEDNSVDCVITSPPYYGLRDYGISNQLGLEETPEEYVANMVAVFQEVRRILKPHGTLWLNIGDSYARSGKGQTASRNLKSKDLIGIPWMLAFALRADGWYLRSDIIWHKPNPMPESVTDRPTKSHEHLFLLSKSSKYYYDNESIKEPTVTRDVHVRDRNGTGNKSNNIPGRTQMTGLKTNNYDKRNRRDVWTIGSSPYRGSHFATFPPALVEPCIKAGTSEKGVCSDCGAPWERVVERTAMVISTSEKGKQKHEDGLRTSTSGTMVQAPSSHTIGWQPTCAHDAEPVPAIVFDPFLGSGTTALVARQLGRRAVGTDLNFSYLHQQARKRLEVEPAYRDGPHHVETAPMDDLPLFSNRKEAK